MNRSPLDEFTHAYIRTLLWSSLDDDGTPLDSTYTVRDMTPEALAQCVSDCERFQRENAEHLNPDNCLKYGPDFGPLGRAGHDYWLTRNGHGYGYWDGHWAEPAASALTEAAERAGYRTPYVADGRVHLANG